MKRVKGAVILILLIMAYSVLSLFVLKYQTEQLRGSLEEVQRVYEAGDTQGALILSNELNKAWHKYERIVTVLVHDAPLDELSASIAKITPFISNENEELIAELQSLYHRIDRIYEDEFPTWYNIM